MLEGEKFNPEYRFGFEDIENAKIGFERMARRLDESWSKKHQFTNEEQKEIDLIMNNAMVMQELLDKKEPPELEEAA